MGKIILGIVFILVWLIPVIIGILGLIASHFDQAAAYFLLALLIWVVADRIG